MNIPQKKILVSCLNQSHLHVDLVQYLLYIERTSPYLIDYEFPADKPITVNRNNIAQRFLKGDYDYLVMIDDDIIPPRDFLKLVDYDVDIITPLMFAYRSIGVVPLILERQENRENYTTEELYLNKALKLKVPPILGKGKTMYNVSGQGKGEKFHEGLLEVDATGTGAIVIKRRVLEDMKSPYFVDIFDDKGDRILGQDINFCKRAKELGFKVFVHLDYEAGHYVPANLKDLFSLAESKNEVVEIGSRNMRKGR